MAAMRLLIILAAIGALGALIAIIYNGFYQKAINRRLASGETSGRSWPSPLIVWLTAVILILAIALGVAATRFLAKRQPAWTVQGFCTAERLEEDGVTVGELTGTGDSRTLAELAENGFAGCSRAQGSDADFDYDCFFLPEYGVVIRAVYKGDIEPAKFGASLRVIQDDMEVASSSGVYRNGVSESGVYYFYFGSSKGKYRYEMDFQLFTAEDLEGFASSDRVLEAIYGSPQELASANGTFTAIVE